MSGLQILNIIPTWMLPILVAMILGGIFGAIGGIIAYGLGRLLKRDLSYWGMVPAIGIIPMADPITMSIVLPWLERL